jgi:hypothetical protein
LPRRRSRGVDSFVRRHLAASASDGVAEGGARRQALPRAPPASPPSILQRLKPAQDDTWHQPSVRERVQELPRAAAASDWTPCCARCRRVASTPDHIQIHRPHMTAMHSLQLSLLSPRARFAAAALQLCARSRPSVVTISHPFSTAARYGLCCGRQHQSGTKTNPPPPSSSRLDVSHLALRCQSACCSVL